MSKPKYPLHEKVKENQEKTQFVHDFLTFCEEKGIFLEKDGVYQRHADLLFEFIGVDKWKFEDEKRKMLDRFRKKTAETAGKEG